MFTVFDIVIRQINFILASNVHLWHMEVWLIPTILVQNAEILPQNGPAGAKLAESGIVSLKI